MDKISHLSQVASLRRYTITEGSGKGLDIIDADNGKVRVLLNVSKALDVLQLYHKGVNMSFICKNGFHSRELPYLERFEGGMLYTCGLDSVGGRDGYKIHGSHHGYIANVTRAECNEKEIIVEAEIFETELFGKNLYFKRTFRTEIGSEKVTITDTLENRAYKEQGYCLLYHINLGYPMLDDGSYIVTEIENVIPRTEWAKTNFDTWDKITSPNPRQEETCYYLQTKTPCISLVNEKLNKKFTVKWSKETLPKFIEWKSMASGDYALGLEPTTTWLDADFEYIELGAKEKKQFEIELEITDKI